MKYDDAGKPLWDGTERCYCGHELDEHDDITECRHEDCACAKFQEMPDDEHYGDGWTDGTIDGMYQEHLRRTQ